MKRRLLLNILALFVLTFVSSTSGSILPARESLEIEFHAFDKDGSHLRWEEFRHKQENGKGKDGDNDKLLDPVGLTVIKRGGKDTYGLYSSKQGPDEKNGDPTVEWPRGRREPVTLSLAWPTTEGYSNLMIDLPSLSASPAPTYPSSRIPVYTREEGKPPVVIFNLLAAQQVLDNLDAALAERARAPFSFPYTPSPEKRETFTSAYNSAKENLRLAKGDGLVESQRGSFGEKAFEAATKATLLMLEDYGVQYARAHRTTLRPKWGVTFEGDIQQPGGPEAPIKESSFGSVRQLVNCDAQDGWVRLIISFDSTKTPKYYQPTIAWAHKHNLKVVGELLDSYDMCCVSKDQWKTHVKMYVDALSDNPEHREQEVDEWEVGNEVNGEWLVHKSDDEKRCDRCNGYASKADFITYAAEYVKKHTKKPTMLTLFWQVGEDEPSSAMFNWLKDKLVGAKASDDKSVMLYLDDIGLSLYPDKAPMGIAFDRVLSTLRNRYFTLPQHRILITELDYWPLRAEPTYTHVWRWGADELNKMSEEPEFQKVRAQVARLYQSAALGYPYSGGGTFWWYYLKEAAPDGGYADNEVWKALHSIHESVAGKDVRCRPDK